MLPMSAPRAEAFETGLKMWLLELPLLMIVLLLLFLVFMECLDVVPSPALSMLSIEEKRA